MDCTWDLSSTDSAKITRSFILDSLKYTCKYSMAKTPNNVINKCTLIWKYTKQYFQSLIYCGFYENSALKIYYTVIHCDWSLIYFTYESNNMNLITYLLTKVDVK